MAAISYDYPVIDASKTYEVPSECSISKLLVEQAPQHIFVGPLFYNALRHQGPLGQPGPRGIGLRLHLGPHFRKCIVVMDLLLWNEWCFKGVAGTLQNKSPAWNCKSSQAMENIDVYAA